jgi:hypothetical protein
MTDDEIQASVARFQEVTVTSVRGARPDPAASLAPLLSLPLNAGRYNYWRIEVINPYWPDPKNAGLFEPSSDEADLAVHKWQDRHYRERFENGSKRALEEYAKADPDAFESVWFRAEIRRLRLARKSEALDRLFTAYRTTQGKLGAAARLRDIERDQRVFRLVADRRRRSEQSKHRHVPLWRIMQDVAEAERPNLRPDTVKEIVRHYQQYYRMVVPGTFSHEDFFRHLNGLLLRMQDAVSGKRI